MSKFMTTAQVLRMLAGSDEPTVLDGTSDPIRFILLTGAEACEQLTAANEARDEALGIVVELRDLLVRVAAVLDVHPLPSEGGSWTNFTLTQEIHRALGQAEKG